MARWPLGSLSIATGERAGASRERVAVVAAAIALTVSIAAFFFYHGAAFLMPGPLTSAHGAIEKCSACHSKSGDGKLSWVHGLAAGDPRADANACLACHKMPETAFNAHGASAAALKQSTERQSKAPAASQPPSARIQSVAFPTDAMMADGVFCATCHQEHQGANFNLKRVSNELCRSCHVAKFDSFDSDHPKFDAYPFNQRTRIVYDHAGHFGKHYPEVASKEPAKRIPETCSTCHNSRDDKRVMSVAPFDKTCASCHLDQIAGKSRASGPKGVAFLSLPGLDLEALKKKNAQIGEWPDASEAELTPFMRVILSRNDEGRALLKAVSGLNLRDLANANGDQIKAVNDLAWTIKRLFHALLAGKASDVLADLKIVGGAKLSPAVVADLTANLPRDVLAGAQQQWLPNLAQEIAHGPLAAGNDAADKSSANADPAPAEPAASDGAPESDEAQASPDEEAGKGGDAATKSAKRDPPACLMRVFGQCLVSKDQGAGNSPAPSAAKPPGAMNLGVRANGGTQLAENKNAAPPRAPAQSDELLFPTEQEQSEINARRGASGKSAAPAGGGSQSNPTDAPAPAGAAPVVSIDSEIDPETWAEYGGWYRQDHTIFYRPTAHKDKFLYTWLFLTGPQAKRAAADPVSSVFDSLTNKDAQGSCTKCHSVDDIPGGGRAVNFSPASAKTKVGRFTSFIHEPHFGMLDDLGCLTCHTLEKGRPYLKSYEHGDPQNFTSDFGAVKKDLCQTCHNRTMARQDCLTCHKYHVHGAATPITATRLPSK